MRLLERHYAHIPLAELHGRYLPHRTPAAIYARARALRLTRPTKIWSTEEDDVLRQHYGKLTAAEIRNRFLPRRSIPAIWARADKLGLTQLPQPCWTAREIHILRQHYQHLPTRVLTARYLPHRTVKGVAAKAEKLGLAAESAPAWTARESAIVKKHYFKLSNHQIRQRYLPHRSIMAIQKHAAELGINIQRAPAWTPAEDGILRQHFSTLSAHELQRYLPHRTRVAVKLRVIKLGLRRNHRTAPWTAAELALIRREYLKPGALQKLTAQLGCSHWTIRDRLSDMGLSLPYRGQWTDEEIALLKRLYPSQGHNAPIPGRTPANIKEAARRFGIRRNKKLGDGTSGPRWSAREYALLREHADLTATELTRRLPGRSCKAIIHARSHLHANPDLARTGK
jgi:hypothetical protein